MKNKESLSKMGIVAYYIGVLERKEGKVRYRYWNPLSYLIFTGFVLVAVIGSVGITVVEVLKAAFIEVNPFKWSN